jgi:signal-transduction protein with cAMP-binding, CBS, and nucleotidyltransferase domain
MVELSRAAAGEECAVQVRDVMTQAAVTESRHDSLRSAAERMWREQTGSLLITEDGRLLGIITERDLLRAVALGADPDETSIDETMTADLFTVEPDMQLQDAARQMAARWIRHLPVVEAGQLLGVVSMRDVTGVFAAMAPGQVRVEHEFDQLVREQRLARIEHGDLD